VSVGDVVLEFGLPLIACLLCFLLGMVVQREITLYRRACRRGETIDFTRQRIGL
jgi:hypothetical protein